jgi:SpoVK/Ycf46/Vps4 family AAA+-type ATPase
MLDNYEKKICLSYVQTILNKKLYRGENVLRTITGFLKDNFSDISISEDQQLKVAFLKECVKQEIKRIAKTPKNVIRKKIELVSELFGLTPKETEVLQLFLFYKINDEMEIIINTMNMPYHSGTLDLDVDRVQSLINIRKVEAYSIKSSLREKGIINIYSKGYFLTETFSALFEMPEINTRARMIKYFLGKNLEPTLKLSEFEHIKNEVNIVKNILKNSTQNQCSGINILFWGEVGTGKTELAKTVSKTAGLKLYAVNHKEQTSEDGELDRDGRLADLNQKQQILENDTKSCILFDEAEDVMNRGFGRGEGASKAYLNRVLEENKVPVIWTTNKIRGVDKAFLRRMTYAIEFKKLSDDVRLRIWKQEIVKKGLDVDENKLIQLNNSYNIPPSIIANAVSTTKLLNGNQDDFEKYVVSLAKLVNKGKDIKQRSVCDCQNYDMSLVNADLDIENLTTRIVEHGKLNFSLCLYGQSGTGKSAYARHLAKQLGIKALLKRASDLMSPYVGQTEINIAGAFEEAAEQEAILVIDEADSFLQSRQMAQRSWEISKVNEMLTCMENHPYPFVCTTNLVDILDEASLRRFTFKIKFNFLKKAQIERAFLHFFKEEAPDEIRNCYGLTSGDFAVVAKKLEYMGTQSPHQITVLLQDELKMKLKDTVGSSLGFQ